MVTKQSIHNLVIRLEARLQPNIGFTFERALTVFTHSQRTPPKVDRFGRNLEHSGYILAGWPWQIWGAIRAVARAEESGKILFLPGKQRTILPISRRPNFTKFEHNTLIGFALNPSEQNF